MSLRRLRLVWIAVAPLAVVALYVAVSDGALAARRAALGVQFTPAVAGGLGAAALFWLALTLVWGRVFCSVGCPAGMVQEWFHRSGRFMFHSRGGGGRRRFVRASPIGLALAMASGLAMIWAGGAWLADAGDPVGLFGRLSDPLAALWRRFVLGEGMLSLSPAMAVAGGLSFALFAVVPLFRGRWFCDRLCPVGACLGVAASVAPRRPTLSAADCVGCGRCAERCPARCIDVAAKTLDARRCVLCLECRDACPNRAIRFGSGAGKAAASPSAPSPTDAELPTAPAASPVRMPKAAVDGSILPNRRAFVFRAGAWAAAAVFFASRRCVDAWGTASTPAPPDAPMPPGAGDWTRYRAQCVSCQSCVRACPAGIIRSTPAGLTPLLSYERDYCRSDCIRCADACPTGALHLDSPEDKLRVRVAATEFFPSRCVVRVRGTACGACAEVCPTQAVTMVEQGGGLPTVPDFDARYCVGCGACYWACPERPRAFAIRGLALQERGAGPRPIAPAPNQLKPPDEQGLYDFPF